MTNKEWLNNTIEGQIHKNLMIFENNLEIKEDKVFICEGCGSIIDVIACDYCGMKKEYV